jgi:mitogen-activated protein kinase organizer 1
MAAFPHKQHTEMKGHVGPVFVVRFNKDGDYCLTGGKDRSVCLWNPHKGVRIKEYAGEHGYEVLDVQVTNDNSKFASCGGDKNTLLWDVSTGRIIRRFRGHEGKVNSIAFNKDGGVLVSAGYDTNLLCWDMRATAYKPMQTISNEFKDSVTCVTCIDDAIIACSIDGSLKQFDIRMVIHNSSQGVHTNILSISLKTR